VKAGRSRLKMTGRKKKENPKKQRGLAAPQKKREKPMSTIIRMTPYGRSYLIKLDCGHALQRSREEVKAQQLYVEKRIGCAECAEIERGYDKLATGWIGGLR
jgi:hypothetical protein